MSGIFISHADSDEAEARSLLVWLRDSGRQDIFIDLDPQQGLQAGEHWQNRLLDEISGCEAMLCLLTEAWIESKWCWAEYVLAKKLGKRCLPLIVRQLDLASIPGEILAEHQIIDLVNDDQCWHRLESGLRSATIEATAFALPPDRPPYPGLACLTETDAALFFGRDPEILAALDELRRISEIPGAHLFAIIGPSGAGKSSFLQAGLLPRLLRDDRNFLPLPALRPSGGILDGPAGFWSSLQGAFARSGIPERLHHPTPRSRGAIKSLVEQDEGALYPLVDTLRMAAGRCAGLTQDSPQTLLLPIDQGEELFNPEYRSESQQFLTLINSELVGRMPIIVIIATRTDAYELIQTDPHFTDIRHRPFTLSPLPVHRYPDVIKGPAALVGLTVEATLTDALVSEASGADALPIVAFTLERLYRDFGAEGRLTLEHYRATGGVAGAIDVAFQNAMSTALERALSPDHHHLLMLVRQLFIPHLVRVDETGAFARRSTRLQELPPVTRPIAEILVDNRLLVLNEDLDGNGNRLEIAHEALVRSWPQLASWLIEERAFLTWREEIRRARIALSEGRRDLLAGRELSIASTWKLTRGDDLSRTDLKFIRASEERAEAATARGHRLRTRITGLAIVAALVMAALASLSTWQASNATRAQAEAEAAASVAERQSRTARARELSVRARTLFENNTGDTNLAGLLAAESLRTTHTLEAQQLAADILALSPRTSRTVATQDRGSTLRVSPDGRVLLDWTHDGFSATDAPASGSVVILDPESFESRSIHPFGGRVWPAISPTGRWLAISGRGRRLEVIDLNSDTLVTTSDYDTLIAARFDASGEWLYVADLNGIIEKRKAPDWQVRQRLEYPVEQTRPWRMDFNVHPSGKALLVTTGQGLFHVPTDGTPSRTLPSGDQTIFTASYDTTGKRILTVEDDDAARLRKAASGEVIATLVHDDKLSATAFSVDGERVVTATEAGDVILWNAENAVQLRSFDHDDHVNAVTFSPDGSALAVGDDAGVVRVWDTESGELKHEWIENDQIWTLAFTNEGLGLVSGARNNQLRSYDLTTGAMTHQAKLSGSVHTLTVDPVSGAIAVGVRASDHDQSWLDMRAIDRASGSELWSMDHNGDFTSLIFNPDGNLFATTTGGTGRLSFWDTVTGSLKFTSTASGYRDSLKFTADGSRLVAKADTISIVNPRDGELLATIGEPGGVSHLGIADDRRTVITYGEDFTFRSWDALTGKEQWRRRLEKQHRSINLSGDGSRYAYRSDDGFSLRVQDTRTGADISHIPLRNKYSDISLSRDGSRVLVNNRDSLRDPSTGQPLSNVELWNLDNAETLADIRHERPFFLAKFIKDNNALLWSPTAGWTMLDTRTGEFRWKKALGPDPIWPSQPNLSTSGDSLLLSAGDRSDIIDPLTGNSLIALQAPVGTHAQTQDGKILAGVVVQGFGNDKRKLIRLFDMQTGDRLDDIDVSTVKASISDIQFSTENRRLVVQFGSSEETSIIIKIFELATGDEIGMIESDSPVRRFELLADPDLLLTQDFSSSIRVWRLSTGKEVHRVAHGHSAEGVTVAGRVNLAATWSEASLRVWDLATGEQRAQKLTQGAISTAALHPDGSRIAYLTKRSRETIAGSAFDAILLWSPDQKGPPTELPIEEAGEQLAFDPVGRSLAAQIGKRLVRVWDLESLRPLLTVTAMPRSETDGFVFSQDGRRLLVVEKAKTGYAQGIRTFNIETGEELARLHLRGAWQQVTQSASLLLRQEAQWREVDLDSSNFESAPWQTRFTPLFPLSDGKTVAGSYRDSIKLVNLVSGEASEIPGDDDAGDISDFNFTSDSKRIVLAQRNIEHDAYLPGKVILRDLHSGSVLGRTATDWMISKLVFVDDDRSIAMLGPRPSSGQTSDSGTRLYLWRWQSQKLELLSTENPIAGMSASPDKRLLATAEGVLQYEEAGGKATRPIIIGKPRVRIWDTESGTVIRTLASEHPVSDVQFSPDGTLLVARGSRDFKVYETVGWTEVQSFRLDHGLVGGTTSFAGNDWVVAPAKGGLYLFSARSGQERFLRHDANFPDFRVSTDGRTIAAASRSTLAIWDVASGQPRFRRSFARSFGYALVGPQASLHVTEDYLNPDGSIQHIPWKSVDLVEALCQRVGRGFSADEIDLYFEADFGEQPACTVTSPQ